MEKKTGIALTTALLSTLLLIVIGIAIPINFSNITIAATIKGMDAQGNISTLASGQFTTVSYPSIKKIQLGTTLTFNLVGMTSTKIAWWLNYRIFLTSKTSGKTGDYAPWAGQARGNEGDWAGDSATNQVPWAAYWLDPPFSVAVTNGQSLDLESCKRQWYENGGWHQDLPDGWLPLDPATKNSFGDWIKWKWGETPAGDYEAKVSLRVKVNYFDNQNKEKNAIGPPYIRGVNTPTGANGELVDILAFTINYQPGSLSVTVAPKLTYTWIPLDVSGDSPDIVKNILAGLANSGLPNWTLHALLAVIAAVSWIATFYFKAKE
jgi:hypothetical protein